MINLKALNRSIVSSSTLHHVYNDEGVVSISCVGFNKELYIYVVKDVKGNKYTLYSPKFKEGD